MTAGFQMVLSHNPSSISEDGSRKKELRRGGGWECTERREEGGREEEGRKGDKNTQQCYVLGFICLSEEHDVKPHTEKSKWRAQILGSNGRQRSVVFVSNLTLSKACLYQTHKKMRYMPHSRFSTTSYQNGFSLYNTCSHACMYAPRSTTYNYTSMCFHIINIPS